MKLVPTASQTVGPFFSIGLAALCREKVSCEETAGAPVTIRGRVLDGDGEPVPDSLLEIWQLWVAEGVENGKGVTAPVKGAEIPVGFGRVATNERGEFCFAATKQEARIDEEGNVHAPHLVVVLLMRGLLRALMTRIYFAGETSNAEDFVLRLVPEERRETLLAVAAERSADQLRWDVRLQSERETVFFEV